MPSRPDRHLSVRDAAAALGVPDSTVRLWLARGDLTGGVDAADPNLRRVTPPPQWVTQSSVDAMLRKRKARAGVRLAVTVGALKGGCGKTATTWALASLLALEGGRVLVIDADPNSQTLYSIANRYTDAGGVLPWRVVPWSIHDRALIANARRMADEHDHVLIDTGPDGNDLTLFQAACRIAPLLVMTFAPRDVELMRLLATVEAARRGSILTQVPVWPVVLLNRVASRSPAAERAREELKAAPPPLCDVPVLDCEVRDLAQFTRFTAPLTRAEAGDHVGVLDELRAFTAQIEDQEL